MLILERVEGEAEVVEELVDVVELFVRVEVVDEVTVLFEVEAPVTVEPVIVEGGSEIEILEEVLD